MIDLLKSTTALSGAPIRVALYGRFSDDKQNPKSVDGQFLVCREYAAQQPRWHIVAEFRDEAISGFSIVQRPDIQKLLAAATRGEFDIVLAEAMDRLSRDDVDMPYIAKKLRFAGVRIFTKTEGEVTKLHVGMKGTMNSVFLDDLKEKTHRGLEWAVSVEGKVIGRSYGYDTVREFDPHGAPIRGKRNINPEEATIIIRILTEYANGSSPDAIVARLREEGVPGPNGKPWASWTIRGDARRGVGIINNELYIGKIVWNRTTHPKHPDTGKPVNRVNPREKWITGDAPELRIVSDELWGRVKIRQRELTEKYASVIAGSRAAFAVRSNPLNETHRPNSFLSGLMYCGVCGGRYTARGHDRFSCKNHRVFHSCPNERSVAREDIEGRALAGLCGSLLDQVNIDKGVQALIDETERLNRERRSGDETARKSLAEVQKKLDHIIAAIERGAYSDILNKRLRDLEAEKQEAEKRVACEKPAEVCIPGNFAEMLRRKVNNLPATLQSLDERDEAILLVRELVDRVVITPDPDQACGSVVVKLYGCLGVLLDRIAGSSTEVLPSVESGAGIHRWHQSVEIPI
jgi:site-specific DNA recombinase